MTWMSDQRLIWFFSYPSNIKITIDEKPQIEFPHIVLCLNSLHSKISIGRVHFSEFRVRKFSYWQKSLYILTPAKILIIHISAAWLVCSTTRSQLMRHFWMKPGISYKNTLRETFGFNYIFLLFDWIIKLT